MYFDFEFQLLAQEFPLGGTLVCVGAPILLVLIWVAVTFNRLINLRNLIKNSWSNVDTELKRRYDLIPNLVETVKGYAAHERDVLQRLTEARSRAAASTGSPASQAADENELVRALRRTFAVVEGYPDLKANQNFLKLQGELINTEDRIQAARRYFNGNVKDMNNCVQMFPSNLIARMFGFSEAEYFEIEDTRQREAVQMKLS
jgi:LemA protein